MSDAHVNMERLPASARQPSFDKHGYPTEETLRQIAEWPCTELSALLDYVMEAWNEDYGAVVPIPDGKVALVTGGWSGNEELIAALLSNYTAWTALWRSSERGGRYFFARVDDRKPL